MKKACQDFLTYMDVEKGYSEKTLQEYQYDIEMFQRFVQKEKVEEITTWDIRRFLRHLKREREYKNVSLHRKICSLRSFFNFLENEKLIENNPVSRIESPKIPKSLPKTITIEETVKIINAAEKIRNKAILVLLYSSGLRVSELCNLKVDDMDFEEQIIRVNAGKGKKDRVVPLNDTVIKLLRKYLESSKELRRKTNEQMIFLNRYGNALSVRSVQRIVKKIKNRANIDKKVTPHVFRHAFATHLIEGGADIRVIQELLGHSSLQTTQIYTHVSLSHLRDSYDKGHPITDLDIS